MEADIITISDRPAGLVGSVLRGLGAMSVAVAFLAGIMSATWVTGESETTRPSVSRAAANVPSAPAVRPGRSEALAIYLVSSSEQKSAVEEALEKLRQGPGLGAFGAAVFYIAEDADSQGAPEARELTDLNAIRLRVGLPEAIVVDLRPPVSR